MIKTIENNISQSALDRLAYEVSGAVIRPNDTRYAKARAVWNGMIDRQPAVVVEVDSAEDVALCIRFARQNNLALSVRGGGHNVAGFATNDGGIVIDLRRLNKVVVNTATNTVLAGGGTTIGELDAATHQHNLAVPMGVVSATGIAGLTLSGGMGWMRNKYGLACDNLVSAEIVTADGIIVQASETMNRDLLWGLRGGGGNFGVVTRFEFRAFSLDPQVYMAAVFFDGNRADEALRFFRETAPAMPEEYSLLAILGRFVGDEAFPAHLHGEPFVLFLAVYIGAAEDGAAAARPLYQFGEPILDFSGVMGWQEAQQFFDADYPDGARYYWKSQNMNGLSDDAIGQIVAGFAAMPAGESTIDIWHNGGMMRRISAEHAAFATRNVEFLFNVEANWHDPALDNAHIDWSRTLLEAMEPFAADGRYVNFPGFNEEADLMQQSFGSQYERLVALKRKWDPTNLFHLNSNIDPNA